MGDGFFHVAAQFFVELSFDSLLLGQVSQAMDEIREPLH
jgi:hypothetical protein